MREPISSDVSEMKRETKAANDPTWLRVSDIHSFWEFWSSWLLRVMSVLGKVEREAAKGGGKEVC